MKLSERLEEACTGVLVAEATGNLDIVTDAVNKLLDAAREAAELARRVEWQPIETAPRDGMKILGFDPHWRDPICVISWSEWGEWHDWSGVHTFRSATHWCPLPDPPRIVPEAGQEVGK